MRMWIRILVVVIGMVIGHSISVPEAKAAQNYCVSEISGNDSNTGKSTSKPFKTLRKAVATAQEGDAIYVMDTLHLEESLEIKKGVTIGRFDGATGYLIVVKSGNGLVLGGNVVITGRKQTMTAKRALILVESGAKLYLKGNAVIRNNLIDDVESCGGGIVNRGRVYIEENAKVTGNVTNKAGGGGIYNIGTLSMSGGTISSNVAGNYNTAKDDILNGGGVLNGGEMYMEGGTITQNSTKTVGGGVHGGAGSVLFVSGGIISSNTARIRGGGYGGKGASIILEGGKITGNTAAESGGVHITRDTANENSSTLFYMKNGEISANKAVGNSELGITGSAGGVLVNRGVTMVVQSGVITGNTCQNNGGGIYVGIDAVVELKSAAKVTKNGANRGGGIMIGDSGQLLIEEATVQENQAKTGSGVYQNGTMRLNGKIGFLEEDEVYLPNGKYVTVLDMPDTVGKRMVLVPSAYFLGRVCVRVENEDKPASDFFAHFLLKEKQPYLLRPGNYLHDTANVKDTDVVISRSFGLFYKENTGSLIQNMPEDDVGYWKEPYTISDQIPVWNSKILFQEWNTKADGSGEVFQPECRIDSLLDDLILYAQWGNKPPVIKAENTYAVEDEVGERVTETFLKSAAVAEDPEDGDLKEQIVVENWEQIKHQLSQSYTEQEREAKERKIQVKYRVEDSCGEEAKATASLTIFLLDETTYEKLERIRFLNEHYVDRIEKSTRWGGTEGQERLQQLFETDTSDIPWESL